MHLLSLIKVNTDGRYVKVQPIRIFLPSGVSDPFSREKWSWAGWFVLSWPISIIMWSDEDNELWCVSMGSNDYFDDIALLIKPIDLRYFVVMLNFFFYCKQ